MPNHRIIRAFAVFAIATLALAIPAAAYDFPSTNDSNRTNGWPHVNPESSGVGEVTLAFVNDTNALAYFEYRIDGAALTNGTAHPVVDGDYIYPGHSSPAHSGTTMQTFAATSTVEVRLALGGERDWDFDWVTFHAVPDAASHDDCADGGWELYGFANQGQCVRFVNGGGDSRP